jgi:flagellin-like protein
MKYYDGSVITFIELVYLFSIHLVHNRPVLCESLETQDSTIAMPDICLFSIEDCFMHPFKGLWLNRNHNPYEEKTKMNFRKIKRNFRKDVRAISPVIATLLMIAIAVVASLVAYAWVMGYMGFTTQKTGLAIQIQSISQSTGTIYVQNVGNDPVKFSTPLTAAYLDGAAKGTSVSLSPVPAGSTTQIVIGAISSGQHTIKVVSDDGTFSEVSKVFP